MAALTYEFLGLLLQVLLHRGGFPEASGAEGGGADLRVKGDSGHHAIPDADLPGESARRQAPGCQPASLRAPSDEKLSLYYAIKLKNNPRNPTHEGTFMPRYINFYTSKASAIKSFGLRVNPILTGGGVNLTPPLHEIRDCLATAADRDTPFYDFFLSSLAHLLIPSLRKSDRRSRGHATFCTRTSAQNLPKICILHRFVYKTHGNY